MNAVIYARFSSHQQNEQSIAREQLTNENIDKISHEVEAFCEKEKDRSNLKRLNRELNEVNKSIDNLIKAIEEGKHINLLSDRITQKENEKAEIEKAIALEKLQYVNLSASEIKFFLTRLKTGDIDGIKYRKMLITVLIHSVYLYDDGKLMIVFNAGDKPLTIDADEIDGFEQEFGVSGLFLNAFGSPVLESENAHFTAISDFLFFLSFVTSNSTTGKEILSILWYIVIAAVNKI